MSARASKEETTLQQTLARREKLTKELIEYRRRHQRSGSTDAFLHQTLIIGSAISSVVAASAAAYIKEAWIIGLIGAVPGMAALLSQQLHCVEAANLHFRRVQVADALLTRLHYELPIHASEKDIAQVAQDFRGIEEKLTLAWEEITSSSAAQKVAPKNRPQAQAGNSSA